MPQYHLYIYIIFLIIMAIIGIGAFIIGFLWMQKRRPVIITHQGWYLGYLFLLFVFWTLFLASFVIRFLEIDNENISFGSILIVVLLSALPAFLLGVLPRFWRSKSTANAMIFGINKKVLGLIRQALEKEGIAYDEAYEDFTLLELNARIYTTIWGGIGYAVVKIDPKRNLPVLEKIIQFMKEYDKDHNDHFSLRFMILLVFCGLLLAGIGLFLAYSFIKMVIG